MAYQDTTPWLLPTQVRQDDAVGDTQWSFEDEIKINDMEFAPDNAARSHFVAGGDAIIVREIRLVLASAVASAENKGADQNVFTNTTLNVGGSSDDWSETLTGADVNREDFGVAVAYGTDPFGGGANTTETWYIIGEKFNLSDYVPEDATIDGIEVQLIQDAYAGGGGTVGGALDCIKIRVTFSFDIEAEALGIGGGECYVADTGQEEPQKKVRYLVFDPDNNFVGEWRDVISDVGFKRQINNPLANMDVRLGRTELTRSVITEPLLTEGDEPILTEDDQPILIDIVAALGLGEGTDLDLNFNVDVIAYWGKYEPLLTEDDRPILTEDDKYILVENGAPNGRTIFSGYVADWELDIGEQDTINVPLLNHGNELNHIMLLTEDTEVVDQSTFGTNSYGDFAGWAGGGPTDITDLAQTFVQVGTVPVSKISLFLRAGWVNSELETECALYTGAIGSLTPVAGASGEAIVTNYLDYVRIDYIFDEPVTLTNGVTYTIVPTHDYFKTGGNPTYPVNWRMGASYASGQAYYKQAGGAWTSFGAGIDFAFIIWEAGEDTTVPYLSQDPSDIARSIIDFARQKGAHINYDEQSIEDTGTTVSYTFNTNTVKEALDKVLELCPADWFWTYDVGTDLYSLKARPESPDRYFTKKNDIVKMKLRRSIRRLINEVWFTGGGDPALFKRYLNQTARDAYRPGLAKLTDNRVTLEATAEILSESAIDRQKDPEYIGSATISTKHYDDIEDILLGDESGFMNFGNFIDMISLQIVEIDYKLDLVDLGFETILPPVTKRVEDIKRNLDVLEQQNNPTSPT